jgi:hypothetical protein
VRRGGAIQAALNLEFTTMNANKIDLKLESKNGKMPNLDLLNAITRICGVFEVECTLDGDDSPQEQFYSQYYKPSAHHKHGLKNLIAMLFKQATGVPTSAHGYFLEFKIEALTLTGIQTVESMKKRQNIKYNMLKVTR